MPYTLLIADRDPAQFELFDLIFHADSYQLQTFTDGEAVLAYLREHTPDLAILDTHTPLVDGFNLCRKMRRVKRLKGVPVILTTSQHLTLDDEVRRLAEVVKADLILPKPLGDKNLRARIKELLGGRKPHAYETQLKETQISQDSAFAETLWALERERQRLHASLLPTDRSQEPKEMKKLRALVELQEEQIEVLEARWQELEARLAQREGQKEPSRLRRWLT